MPPIGTANNGRDTFVSPELKAQISWRLFIFSLIGAGTVFFAYIGLEFGYKGFLDRSIVSLDSLIEEKPKFGPDSEKNIVAFYSQVVNLRKLLNAHVSPSVALRLLEASTHPRVAYLSANLSVPVNTLLLEGIADSYETVVKQVATYEKYDGVEKAVIMSSSLDNNIVNFSVRLTLKPGLMLFKNIK